MLWKIIFNLLAFVLFVYIFLFKLIKKNDTTYLYILVGETIGILLSFVQILLGIFTGVVSLIIMYILCLILPTIVLILELNKINFSEIITISISKLYIFLGKTKRAKENLIKLVTKYNDSYYGHKLLAEIYKKEGGMRKSIDEYVKVLDIKKDDYNSYFEISMILKGLEKTDESIQMLKTLTSKKPDLYEANRILGEMLIEKEDFKEAIGVYIETIKYNKDKEDLYYNLGISYSRINDFNRAKKCFEKATEINSNMYNAYYRLGQIALLYSDFDVAEEAFLKSLYNEFEAKSYFQLTKIYMMKNKRNKAIIFINKAIESNPEYYKIAKEEPMLFSIKQSIEKVEIKEEEKKQIEQNKKEADIEKYLDDTYNLTRTIKEQNNKKENKINKLKWNK